ncbi:hypothetical protein BDA99DRAFT_537515 [Phascolomyces articulosus]|uniref:Uncharacterized protein n=1 Tax=Phascolomyces articulosus TaxID=60185 RepID=A0AAD5JZL0_9FUNG|nr:hypothetical protein BDA99DRAFT_537515 [Phascolomyces articulosus]
MRTIKPFINCPMYICNYKQFIVYELINCYKKTFFYVKHNTTCENCEFTKKIVTMDQNSVNPVDITHERLNPWQANFDLHLLFTSKKTGRYQAMRQNMVIVLCLTFGRKLVSPKKKEEDENVPQFSPSVNKSNARKNHVTHNALLLQICKHFIIKYLCVYSNFCKTLVIVPEVHVRKAKDFTITNPMRSHTQACGEAEYDVAAKSPGWVLEEAMLSKCILVLRTDAYLWQHNFHSCEIPTTSN